MNDREQIASAMDALLKAAPVSPLGPGSPRESHRRQLAELAESARAARRSSAGIVDMDMFRCCLAGLWLAYDFLDESHRLSQDIDSIEGSYWHGLMHRREPDFANSKYWFRRVGRHEVFSPLAEQAAELSRSWQAKATTTDRREAAFLAEPSPWRPEKFIDLCQTALARSEPPTGLGNASLDELCRDIASAELRLLFCYCRQRAFGVQ